MDAEPGPAEAGTSTLALVTAPAPRTRASRKAGPRPEPERSDALAHLDLEALRSYRRALSEEENRVSYWRRILQARLDVVRAGLDGGSARDVDTRALAPVLTDARVGAGRSALLQVVPVDDIPPLPRVEQLWDRPVDLADRAAAEATAAELAEAERRLSEYRAALHRSIERATGELIARYREQPALCLSALPLPASPRPADPHRVATG